MSQLKGGTPPRTKKRLPIRHIGYSSLCSGKQHEDNHYRTDLGAKRYKQLGVRERFKDEAPYRVCKRCIAIIVKLESAWKS